MVYGKSSFKHKKKKKIKGPIAKTLDVSRLRYESEMVTYQPTAAGYLRPGSETASNIPSHITTTQFVPNRTGMMDPVKLAKETPEVREAIIAKSKRLAPAFNKGAIQYITDDADIQTLGRKMK